MGVAGNDVTNRLSPWDRVSVDPSSHWAEGPEIKWVQTYNYMFRLVHFHPCPSFKGSGSGNYKGTGMVGVASTD